MKKLCAGLLIGCGSILGAQGYIFLEANIYQSANHFGGSGNGAYAYFGVSFDGETVVSAEVSSPSGAMTGSGESSSSTIFPAFDDLRSEIQGGLWTLTVGTDEGGGTVLTTYQFEVNIGGISNPEPFSILNPLNGATGVPGGETLFTWSPPADVFDTQGVDLSDVTARLERPSNPSIGIAPEDSSFLWEAPGLQESKRYLFYVQYSKDVTSAPDVSISTPTDESFNTLSDFNYSIRLHNEATTVFTTVPEPGEWAMIVGIGLGSLALGRRWRSRSRVASV